MIRQANQSWSSRPKNKVLTNLLFFWEVFIAWLFVWKRRRGIPA